MTEELLDIRGLSVAYAGAVAVSEVSLSLGRGEVMAILGPNGAGKSSLLRAVMGLAPTTKGSVSLAGVDLTPRPAEWRARNGLAYVPEGRRIFPGLTVQENLEVAARTGTASRRAALESVLTLFPQLAKQRRRTAWRLSGGQQQMLAIGRALMGEPRVLLLDEPSLGLAPAIIADVSGALVDIVATGTAILLAEQNAQRIRLPAARTVYLRQGRLSPTPDGALQPTAPDSSPAPASRPPAPQPAKQSP